MPMSAGKRAFVAIAVLLCIVIAGASVLLYRWLRPLKGADTGNIPEILTELPRDAAAVAYIDVASLKRLQGTPLASMLGLAGADPKQDRDYQDFVRDTGFDYARDLDHAAIAFFPATRSNTNDRTVAIADGRFDQAKIKAYALRTGKVLGTPTQPIYVVPGSPPVAFEFLASTRIAIASGPGTEPLFASLKPSPFDTATQARLERVSGAPVFAIAKTDNLPAGVYDNLRAAPQFQNLAHSIEGLTLAGEPDADLIHLTLDAECDSMKNAVELATVLDGLRFLGSMALSDPKTRSQLTKQQLVFLTALLNQARLSHQDRWVRVTLDVTPAMLGAATSGPNAQAPSSRTATLPIASLVR